MIESNRAGERALLRNGVSSIDQGLQPLVALTRMLYRKIRQCQKSASVYSLISYIYLVLSKTRRSQASRIACAKGCSHCCHGWVSARAPEIFYLAAHIRSRVTPPMSQVAAHAAAIPFADREKTVTPCALLKGCICSAYSARPLNCRISVSLDSVACREAFILRLRDDVPVPQSMLWQRTDFSIALVGALERAGLASGLYELQGGLLSALHNPEAEREWLNQASPFEGVQQDPDDAIRASPLYRAVMKQAFG
jgi:hypothetical protein